MSDLFLCLSQDIVRAVPGLSEHLELSLARANEISRLVPDSAGLRETVAHVFGQLACSAVHGRVAPECPGSQCWAVLRALRLLQAVRIVSHVLCEVYRSGPGRKFGYGT